MLWSDLRASRLLLIVIEFAYQLPVWIGLLGC